MSFFLRSILVALFLAGCGSTGPIVQVSDELYHWVSLSQSGDQTSDQSPIISDPTVTFRLAPGQRRSALKTGDDWRIGQSLLFGFDIRLDPESLSDDTFTISRFTRVTAPTDEIVTVSLSRQRGVTVFGRSCIPPERLSEWHRLEMRIRIANNDNGFLEVFCDRKPIWAQEDIRTTFKPICRLRDGCEDDIAKPARFAWQIGLMSETPVTKYAEIQMQRLHQRLIFYIPNRPGAL